MYIYIYITPSSYKTPSSYTIPDNVLCMAPGLASVPLLSEWSTNAQEMISGRWIVFLWYVYGIFMYNIFFLIPVLISSSIFLITPINSSNPFVSKDSA